MGIYDKGYKKSDARAKENEKKSAGKGSFLYFKDGDEDNVVFIDPEPVTFDNHEFFRGRGQAMDEYVCINADEDCPICEAGHNARLVGVYKVYSFKQKKVLWFKQGITVLKQIQALYEKGRIENKKIEISRKGSGAKDTAYHFFVGDKVKIPTKILDMAKALSLKKQFPVLKVKELKKAAKSIPQNKNED